MTVAEVPLRIAMTSYYLPSDSKIGVGYQAHAMANALVGSGHHVTMFSPCSAVDDARYEHRQVPMSGSLRTFRWAWKVRNLDLSSFDVLHSHGDDHLRAGRPTPRHIRTIHGSCFDEAIHIAGLKERLRMGLLGLTEVAATFVADETVCVSRATTRWYPWVKTVIPNGVDLTRFRPGTAREEVPTILFVGTYEHRKRGRLLVDAFEREILLRFPDTRLWMVCSDAPPRPNVDVLGRVTDADLVDLYQRAWVFCLPSSYEGFGVPYIEAMASGTPVVATPNAGAREVLDDGKFGLLVEEDDLGSAIISVIESEKRSADLSRRGLERSRDYSWERVIKEYEHLYYQVGLSSGRVHGKGGSMKRPSKRVGKELRHRVLVGANRVLRRGGVQLVHAGKLGDLQQFHDAYAVSSPAVQDDDPSLAAYIRTNADRVDQLRSAYDDVGLGASEWADDNVSAGVDLQSFRADNMYVFQARGTPRFQYVETARYVKNVDHLGLAARLEEDGAFGVTCVDADGWTVSRDLLDSILEINFLDEQIGLASMDRPVVLDIGAGYGRLAHRMTTGVPNIERYLCTDGVPISTFTQEFYLGYRKISAGEVVPLHEVGELGPDDRVGVAVNVHSFAEMPLSTSRWWIRQVERCRIPWVFLVTDAGAGTTALEADGHRRGDFTQALKDAGYRLKVKRPKYDGSVLDPRDQLFPADYWLFTRDSGSA